MLIFCFWEAFSYCSNTQPIGVEYLKILDITSNLVNDEALAESFTKLRVISSIFRYSTPMGSVLSLLKHDFSEVS